MEVHGEILAYHSSSKSLLKLSPEERIFVYYLYRASIPFNHILRDQTHYETNSIIKLIKRLRDHAIKINAYNLSKETERYLIYLLSNNGFYFRPQVSDNKITPDKLKLKRLDRDLFDYIDEKDIASYILDPNVTPNNYYGPGFTDKMYESFPLEIRNSINTYFKVENGVPIAEVRSVNGKNASELQIVVYWLSLALHHVIVNENTIYQGRKIFDEHLAPAISYLIQFFITGDEKYFKLHCISWLKTNNIIDWTMGFIEVYDDPKKIRGQAGAEITIKTEDISKLNPVLLELEQKIPIPDSFKRDPKSYSKLNVSINEQIYGAGDYGPACLTSAYCLPNYNEIRNQHGSKQIIYNRNKTLEKLVNKELFKQLKTTKEKAFPYDIDMLYESIWKVQVIAHETIGHGSGRYGIHKSGVQVTDINYNTFMTEDIDSLEELRSEINALYLSIFHIDELSKIGLYDGWNEKISKEELQKWCIVEMARVGIQYYTNQTENFTQIIGAHERANIVLTNYLIHHGGIIDTVETVNNFNIVSIEVIDLEKAKDSIIELLQKVQIIKSTADDCKCKELFRTYTTYPISIEKGNKYRSYLENIKNKLFGQIKMLVRIYSRFVPIVKNGKLIDIDIDDTEDFLTQNLRLNSLTFSTKLE